MSVSSAGRTLFLECQQWCVFLRWLTERLKVHKQDLTCSFTRSNTCATYSEANTNFAKLTNCFYYLLCLLRNFSRWRQNQSLDTSEIQHQGYLAIVDTKIDLIQASHHKGNWLACTRLCLHQNISATTWSARERLAHLIMVGIALLWTADGFSRP